MHSNTRQALNASTRSVYAYAKWYWVNHGRLTSERQAHQRTQSLPSATHRHSSITPPAARALKRQASCLLRGLTSEQSCTRTLDRQRTIMHSNTRQALHASTRSVYVKWYWVNHGRLTSERQAHQRMQTSSKAYLTLPIVTHQSLDLLLERSSAKLLVFYASTRSRRAVEVIICMITRDFSVISIDVTGVSLSLSLSLSLYYSQKSLTHNIGNASAFPIISLVYRCTTQYLCHQPVLWQEIGAESLLFWIKIEQNLISWLTERVAVRVADVVFFFAIVRKDCWKRATTTDCLSWRVVSFDQTTSAVGYTKEKKRKKTFDQNCRSHQLQTSRETERATWQNF